MPKAPQPEPDWRAVAQYWHEKAVRRRAQAAASPAAAAAHQAARAETAEVARLCIAAGKPEMAAQAIIQGATLAQVREMLATGNVVVSSARASSLAAALRAVNPAELWDNALKNAQSGQRTVVATPSLDAPADSPSDAPQRAALAGIDADALWTRAFERARGRLA